MDSITLTEYCKGTTLNETEAWAIVCEVCQGLREILQKEQMNYAPVEESYEKFIITAERLELTSNGNIHINEVPVKNI